MYMDELEILMCIRSDVAEIKAYNVDTQRRLKCLETTDSKYDGRLRRLEVVLLPISACLGYIGVNLWNLLNK